MATSVVLDQSLSDRLTALAELRERSQGYMMRQAISEYVEREEKREAINKHTLEVWEHMSKTGLHVTHEEVVNYMQKLINEGSAELPPCHK